jgi:prevent-host-death family protein
MTAVTAFDAKIRFGELLDRVVRGEEIVITHHDKPVARIIPEGRRSIAQARQTVAALDALRQQIAKRGRGRTTLTNADVQAAIERGRR